MELPSFLAPSAFELVFGERKLRMFAASAPMVIGLSRSPLWARLQGAITRGAYAEGAHLMIVEARDLAGQLVLDSIHEETWAPRPVTLEGGRAFAASLDDATLMLLLVGVARANEEAFRPLLDGLQRRAMKAESSPPTPEASSAS